MSWVDEIDPAAMTRRLGLSALLGVGLTMTMFGSFFVGSTGPIPFKLIPDVRPVISMTAGLGAGLWASGGGASRRTIALWTVVAFVLGFHLEEATVHWIGPFPGSITGTRVGILGTAGSLLAIMAVLLIHVDVERGHLARDLAKRGATPDAAADTARRLAAVGVQRVVGLAVGVAGIGLLVVAGEKIMGDQAGGGAYILIVGGAMLLALAPLLGRAGRRAVGETPAQIDDSIQQGDG